MDSLSAFIICLGAIIKYVINIAAPTASVIQG